MSSPTAFDDPTLVLWRAEHERIDRQRAEQEERQGRVLELQLAFIAVRSGLPEAEDDERSALAFAARWSRIGRLLSKTPELVHRPLDEIEAEPHSCKAYALRFVKTALANEEEAEKILFASWQASKCHHSGVLGWLTWQLEDEIMGRYTETKSSEPMPNRDHSIGERVPCESNAEGPSGRTMIAPIETEESVEWTTPNGPGQWAKMFEVSQTTFRRWLDAGKIRYKKLSVKSYLIAVADLPSKHQAKFRNGDKPTRK